jgi:outer membrane protein assembly factor BamD (BamD/ComL family)
MPEAEDRMNDLNELLARHEWIVAHFYMRNKRYLGALWRLENIRENYPNYSQISTVNEKITEMETAIEERDASWKKHLEELKKASED